MIHSKSDAIFLFGKGAVSLSSPQTINLDSNEKVLISSPKIELGNKAIEKGQPVVKAVDLTVFLLELAKALSQAGSLMAQSAAGAPATPELGASMQAIASAGQIITEEANRWQSVLGFTPETNPIMSDTTFTR